MVRPLEGSAEGRQTLVSGSSLAASSALSLGARQIVMTIGPNFAFVAIPRTGSTMMAHRFLPQFDGIPMGHHHLRKVPEGHRHKFTFTIVRHPYGRMISCWYHLRRCDQQFGIDKITFPEFVHLLTHHWGLGGMNQVDFLRDIRVDKHLRFETLADEVVLLPFNRQKIPLPTIRINAEERPPLEQDLPPENIRAINEHSAPDFEAFGYSRL